MTIAELIAVLSRYEPDARVVVDGYEGGYDEPRFYVVPVRLDAGQSPYCGAHDEGYLDQSNWTPCVVVSRMRPDEVKALPAGTLERP